MSPPPRAVQALLALFAAACAPVPAAPPAAQRPAPAASVSAPVPPSRASAFPPGECASLARGLDEVAGVAAVVDLRATTPEPQIEAMLHRVDALSTSLEKLRDTLRSPVLATEANQLMMAAAYLLHEIGELFGLRHMKGPAGLERYERTIDVGFRQLQLAARSARARCEGDPARDQSVAWKAAFVVAFQALAEPVRACLQDEARRVPGGHVGRIALRVHVGPDGRVTLAGPTDLSPLSSFSGELVHCIVRVIDQATFPRPEGEAIVNVPLGE